MLLLSYEKSSLTFPYTSRQWYDRALSVAGSDVFVEAGDLYRAIAPGFAEYLYEEGVEAGDPTAKERLAELPSYAERLKMNLEFFNGARK
ncbi:hypothetical protein GCM10007079_30660 [Nocardiopsis terrae]|uniref:Uncharacterized protein n=1 Tax=Nocardiopsis terrae TaxID=372655 RepID=A0ABR9HIR8_9ACTN|nr:hypothetical protein [Nocardiopsis terrae]MBE1458893.1 hypothetical protein [Nocardiopsis terrae]GHC86955.1 hypothetical protein GCM10007079_30660 [Nocardiopsis terrae]